MTATTPVYVNADDHKRLLNLAYDALGTEPGAESLVDELTRANVESAPGDAVGMGDRVTFTYDGVRREGFALVYPNEADIADRRISVLSTVGAMLLGVPAGASIDWTGADGREHRITVEEVAKGGAH